MSAGEYRCRFEAQGFRWELSRLVRVSLQAADVARLPDRLSISCAASAGFQLRCCVPGTHLGYTASWSPGEGSEGMDGGWLSGASGQRAAGLLSAEAEAALVLGSRLALVSPRRAIPMRWIQPPPQECRVFSAKRFYLHTLVHLSQYALRGSFDDSPILQLRRLASSPRASSRSPQWTSPKSKLCPLWFGALVPLGSPPLPPALLKLLERRSGMSEPARF